MTPFGDGQPTEIPYPPIDVPTPNLPPANFADIGEQVATGQAKTQPAGWPWRQLIDLLAEIIARVVAALLNCWLSITTYLLKLIFAFFQRSDANMDQLVAASVKGMLGLGPEKGTAGGGASAAQREQYAANIANMIQGALEQNISKNPNGGVAPGNQGANKFLALSAHIAIEGWVQGLMVELGSANYLERFADLKDTLERCMGMGRLARRALHAPMKVLVEEPYTQLLNLTYHPTLLAPAELVRYYLRGGIDRTALQTAMDLHGYSSEKVDELINVTRLHLSPEDVFKGTTTGYFSMDTAKTILGDLGYDAPTAAQFLTLRNDDYTNNLNRKLVEEALALLKEGRITQNVYQDQLGLANLPKQETDVWTKLGDLITVWHKQCKVQECKRPDLGEGLKLLERGIWQLPQYEQLLNYYNYQPSDEFDMAQLAQTEAVDWQALQLQKADALAARQKREADRLRKAQMMVEDIGVSTGEMETLVYEGLRSITQYQQYLRNKSVAEDNIQTLSQALVIKLAQKTAAAAAKLAAQNKAKAKKVDLTQLETAVKQGLMDIPTFTSRVEALGMSNADAGLIAQELQNSISTAATKAQTVAAAKAKAAEKHIDLSQEERAVRLGILQMSDYAQFLAAHGYTPEEQGVLESALQDQVNTDKATAAKKAAAAPKAAAKGINLTQLERLVRAGVKTVADYTAALATAGYDAADQAALTEFLQLQMQQDQQDLIVHGHAAALVDQMGVSLADLERAVKLSVVPIATYQDALQRAGVSAADQQTLTAALAAQIKTTRAQQSTAQSVSKLVAAAGISLATLEKDTLAGKLSIDQFTALLNGYNVPAAEVTDTVALVQDMLDNQRAVASLVAQAGARAAGKGLNLAQITAAYKQQVITEDVWRTDVAGLGYDQANVEILFETLAAQQAAAAAKSASKSGASTTTTAPAGAAPAMPVNGTTPTPTG